MVAMAKKDLFLRNPLDARKSRVLYAAVHEYILNAEPVSSRLIVEKYLPDVSSATVRNELMLLENMGYLQQPHVSAGRIPTDLGYRYYVDNLIDIELDPNEETFIHNLYVAVNKELEDLLQETSALLSELTKYISIVSVPFLNKSLFKHLDLVPLSSHTILLVLITNSGSVEKTVLEFKEEIKERLLSKAERILNQKLKNLNLEEIEKKRQLTLKDSPPELKELLSKILDQIILCLTRDRNGQIFLRGTANILQQPDYESAEKIQPLLEALEQRYMLINFLKETFDFNTQHLIVKIGSENEQAEMKGYSFVVTNYCVGVSSLGVVGIVGPRRMNYAKTIRTVQCIARNLSGFFESLNN
jgi:heat-inducible transcriptional repressor